MNQQEAKSFLLSISEESRDGSTTSRHFQAESQKPGCTVLRPRKTGIGNLL